MNAGRCNLDDFVRGSLVGCDDGDAFSFIFRRDTKFHVISLILRKNNFSLALLFCRLIFTQKKKIVISLEFIIYNYLTNHYVFDYFYTKKISFIILITFF